MLCADRFIVTAFNKSPITDCICDLFRPGGARCTEAGCANLARLILRYADLGVRPISHAMLFLI